MEYFRESDWIDGIICYELCIIFLVTGLFSRPEKLGLQIVEVLIQQSEEYSNMNLCVMISERKLDLITITISFEDK